MSKVTVGVVGLGYWGPNLMRSLSRIVEIDLRYGCDLDEGKLMKLANLYPETRFTGDFEELLADDTLKAVVVASSASTHARLSELALMAGKDVFVEKPLALSPRDAERLVRLADENDRILMVGHLLQYHPAVVQLKRLVDAGEVGEVYYIYTHRLNLGIVRKDENALWSLGPHDLSVIMHLLDQEPTAVQAVGRSFLREEIEDIVLANLWFADGKMAHLHMSWLDPHKERKITVVGSKKMAVFDDTAQSEKLRVYDKGVHKLGYPGYESYGEYVSLRFGDILIPHIPNDEPLKLECEHFVECVVERRQPVSNGYSGLRVVRALDALQRSLNNGGSPMAMEASRTVVGPESRPGDGHGQLLPPQWREDEGDYRG